MTLIAFFCVANLSAVLYVGWVRDEPLLPLHAASEALLIGFAVYLLYFSEVAFGQLPRVAKHLAAIAAGLGDTDTLDIPALLASGGEDVLAVMAIATGKPRTWFDTLHDWDVGVQILAAIIELNKAQFAKKLLPAIQRAMTQMLPANDAA